MSSIIEGGGERDPFALTANPDGYVPTANVGRVLGDAVVSLDEGRVPLVFGPAGLGKTLVLQLVGKERSDRAHPLYIPYCDLPPQELAALAVGLLEQPLGDEPEAQLLEEARRLHRGGRSLLLLIDDAGSLPGETAAQLAHWANASGGALQIALAGLPGPALRHVCDAFGDRAEEILHAGGLRSEEIGRYVKARIERAGADPRLLAAFDEHALAELERVSDGNPRKLHLAAQAIVRNAQHQQQVQETSRRPEREGGEVPRAPLPSAARDIPQVGQYRFVGGRFVDPSSGAPLAEETASSAEEGGAPPEVPSGIDLTLAAAMTPDARDARSRVAAAGATGERGQNDLLAPPAQDTRARLPYASIAVGVVLVAFAVGLLTQLAEDRAEPGAGGDTAETPARVLTPAEVAPATPTRDAPQEDVAPARPETGTVAGAQEPKVVAGSRETGVAGIPDGEPAAEAAGEAEVADAGTQADAEAEVADAGAQADSEAAVADAEAQAAGAAAADAEAQAAEGELAAAAAEPPAPEDAPIPAEVAPPAAEIVRVSINATPWAVIEIDGEEVGETPLAGIELTTGRHRFRAHMPDGDVRERVHRIDTDSRTVVFE